MTVEFASDADAAAALTALKQEEEFKKRSDSSINVQGKSISVDITADDVVALRATANSYLRALQAIQSVNGGNDDE
jgi:tRNA threonylcarbamoyladenosine modification (KEOPS) complex  Pcc1 subunit